MRNKTHSQSNADTQDGDEEESLTVLSGLDAFEGPIRDVWAHNFQSELGRLAALSGSYPVLALVLLADSGHRVSRELCEKACSQFKLLCLGAIVSDGMAQCLKNQAHTGTVPTTVAAWQFNLSFDLATQNSVPESIALLKQAGIDFKRLPGEGIPPRKFAEAFISSGLILNKSLKWVVFHGCYDFAYLLRLLRGEALPKSSQDFYKSLRIYFPTIYDVKEITREEEVFKRDGLNTIASKIGCSCVGPLHQAGSDSLLTIRCYFQLRKILGDKQFEDKLNIVYGITGLSEKIAWQNQHTYPQMIYSQQFYQTNAQHYPTGPLYQYLHSYPHPYSSYTYGNWSANGWPKGQNQ